MVIEDILDSGNTLYFLKNYFLTKGAKSVTVVTLLDKPARRVKPITADLAGFGVPTVRRGLQASVRPTVPQYAVHRHYSNRRSTKWAVAHALKGAARVSAYKDLPAGKS